SVLAHAHGARLAHLVDHAWVRPGSVPRLREGEERIELRPEPFGAAMEPAESCGIVGDVEGEVPAVRLRVVPAPDEGVEVLRSDRERALEGAALEESDVRVEQMDVVEAAGSQIGGLLAQAGGVRVGDRKSTRLNSSHVS